MTRRAQQRQQPVGLVYLVHLVCPMAHGPQRASQHYTGFVERPEELDARLTAHRAGRGARFLAACVERGSDFVLARTWTPATRRLERTLKRHGGATRRCPICTPGTTWGRCTVSRTRRAEP